jgi:hypothetical protein
MTTYYLQSQLTEKLATDANLAEQIELTPQTADSFNGGGYLRTVANWSETGGSGAIFVPPRNRTYKYLSVHNTGSTSFQLTTVETIKTFSNFVVDSVATGNVAAPPLSKQLNATRVNFNTSQAAALAEVLGYNAAQNSGSILLKLNSGNGFRLFDQDGTKFTAVIQNAAGDTITAQTYTTAEFYTINIRKVEAGETVICKANATHTFQALSEYGSIPFYILGDVNTAGTAYQAAQATITGIEA